jgi:hypothetical protein
MACVLYTAFGGSLAPRELVDGSLPEADRPEENSVESRSHRPSVA